MNFRSFDLNLLRVLDALLATGSTTRAGERIGLSQPAVSSALNRLRHALGDPLFVRHGRSLVATDFALSLREPLRAILEQTETLLSGAGRFDPQQSTARFRLAGSDFFAELLMPALADHLSVAAPGIRVQLVDLVADIQVERLGDGGADMAMLPQMELPAWIESAPLMRSRFVVIARLGHPALQQAGIASGGALPLDLFCGLQHVLFSPEGKLSGMGDRALERVGRKRHVAMSLPVFSGVCNAVSQSDLIAPVPQQMAERVQQRLALQILQPPIDIPIAQLVLAWHRRDTHNPAHAWLRDRIADLLAPLDPAPLDPD